MRRRLVFSAALAVLLVLSSAGSAYAWCNGPSGGNGFGTHDWILQEAKRLAGSRGSWVDLRLALPRTDDPDTVFRDFYYHVYDVWGARYGNAPARVGFYYAKTRSLLHSGRRDAASKMLGLLSHYYADICNPLHTDQCAAEERMHAAYETMVQRYTDAPGENSSWVRFNGYQRVADAAARTRAAAAAAHKSYFTLVRSFQAAGLRGKALSITRASLNRAANGLADIIISLRP